MFNTIHVHMETYWVSPHPSFLMCDAESDPHRSWLGLACETPFYNTSHCHWLVYCVLVIWSCWLAEWFRERVRAWISNNFKFVTGNPFCLCMCLCTLTWHCVLFHLTLCSPHPFPRIYPLPYLAHHLWKTFVTTVLPSLMSQQTDSCVLMVSCK